MKIKYTLYLKFFFFFSFGICAITTYAQKFYVDIKGGYQFVLAPAYLDGFESEGDVEFHGLMGSDVMGFRPIKGSLGKGWQV